MAGELVPAAQPPKRGRGRPTLYTEEVAKEILNRYAGGELLIDICADEHLPHENTVRSWYLWDEPGKPWSGFSVRYARAQRMHVEHEIEETKKLSDTPVAGEITTVKYVETPDGLKEVREVKREDMLGHRRLQVDTRKWRIAKMARREYGDQASALDTPNDETLVVEGGLPEPGEPGHDEPE